MRVGSTAMLLLLGCSGAPDAPDDPAQDAPEMLPRVPGNPLDPVIPVVPIAAVNATVEFLNLEGGCWALKVGSDYQQPLNLPAEFRQDGLAVRVVLEPQDNVASICMIGPVVRIIAISQR